jgi:hypothetical protein
MIRYFRRPSRIEQLRSSTGGHLLEGFAKELSQGRYQWVAARKRIRAAQHFLHWIAHRNLSIVSVEERYAQQFLDHLKRCRCSGHHPPLKPHRQKYSVDLWFVYNCGALALSRLQPLLNQRSRAPMLVSFCDWMRRQRGASDATLSIYRFELLRHPHVPSLYDLAGQVPGQSLCVGPYSRSLAALRFAALLTTRSGRKGHSVTRSDDFARKAEPGDPSLACTPGGLGGRHCSASARRSRLEGRHDLCFRKGTPPGRAATDPRGRRCASGLY